MRKTILAFLIFLYSHHINVKVMPVRRQSRIYNVVLILFFSFVICIYSANDMWQSVNTQTEGVKLTILMYHGFTDGGKESDYVLDVKNFEKDIVYLKNQGFSFVDSKDIADYVYKGKKLPEKCVIISFDDGYLNNYIYAYPVIKKHNVKAIVSPIAYYVEYYSINEDRNPNYSHLTDKEIKEMHSSGLIDFGNHSYNMHSLEGRKGSLKLSEEKAEDYIREFYYDLKAAENVIEDITGEKPTSYAYPFGSVSRESVSILKCCGYKVSFGCEEGFNTLTFGNPDCLLKLRRFNRTPKRSAQQIVGG